MAVLHYFGDALYMSQVHIVPNSGFQLGQVSSIEDEQGGDVSEEEEEEPHGDAGEGEDREGDNIAHAKTIHEDDVSPSDASVDVSSMHISDASEEPAPLSVSDMDALLLVCLLRALKYIVSVDDLPLLVSSLWNTLMR